MIEDELRFITCTRKIRYAGKKRAVQVLARMKKELRVYPPNLNVYKCRFCGKYHIGHDKCK